MLYCPGALADVGPGGFGGGQPHILEVGAQKQEVTETRTVTEVRAVTETVAEEQETWSVHATITLDRELDQTYNETAVRLELATLYGVPLSWIQLNATAGSLVLAVTIAPPPSVLASAPSAADVVAAVDATDAATLSQALNATAELIETASLARENVTVLRNQTMDVNVTSVVNVTVQQQMKCPLGHWRAHS